jgi:hypothetical protein
MTPAPRLWSTSRIELERRERLLEPRPKRARDRAVLDLAGVELAAGSARLDSARPRPAAGRAAAACWRSRIASAEARAPAGETASRKTPATARSIRWPPSDWQAEFP